ncbi:hypothetical protein KKH27_11225 [bacterium]|nr:hypothetical protein [bacterium]MBU1983390.1 hypothetical protein [bacterium]
MRLRGLLSLLLLCVCSGMAWGSWISVDSVVPDQPMQMTVRSDIANSWHVELTVPGVNIESVTVPEGTFDLVGLPDCLAAGLDGEPDLPVYGRLIGLQHRGDPEIEILSEEWIDLDGTFDVPFNREGSDAARRAAVNATRNEFLPTSPYELSSRQVIGGVSVAALNVRPVQYNPVQRTVRVLRNVSLRIRETGPSAVPTRPITETTASLLRPLMPNWSTLSLDDIVVRGTYIIIIANNSLKTNLADFATWHNRKGHRVEWGSPDSISSWTTTGIKSFIQRRYNDANPPLEYVCIMGDHDGTYAVPAWSSPDDNDWEYARLDGTDMLPDIAIGRFSFGTTTELAPQIVKTLNYERSPAPPNVATKPNWYKAGGVCGDYHNDTYISTIQTARWIRMRMLEAGYTNSSIDTLYWTNYHGNVSAADMETSIESGVSLWAYRGYLDMNLFSAANADALSNQSGNWPFILTLTCSTNDFMSGDDICEHLMHPINYPSGGAIATIGQSSLSTNTRSNNIMTNGAVQGLLREGIHTTGGCLNRAKLEMYLNYPTDSSMVHRFLGYTNLLGDPALGVFTDTPDTLFVNNPSSISVGTNYLTLTVTDLGSQPVEGAYVNLVKGSEVYMGDWTNASGQVTINFSTTTAESLYVTASKHNYRPAMNRLWVGTATRFVSPATGSFPSAEPGQVVALTLSLKNWGTSSAGGVEATLSTSDPYITGISDNYESYGTIAAGGTVTRTSAFTFTVSSYAPAGHVLQFTLTVNDNLANTWLSTVPISISNGDFEYSTHGLTGVGDGVLDPGESGQIWVRFQNLGTRATPAGLTGYLSCQNSAVTITDNAGVFPSATAGGTCDNQGDPFGITATANAYPGERIPLVCTFPLSSGFSDTVRFNVYIGSIASNAPTPPDEYGYWAFDNTDVAYDKHPTYSWMEIDPREGGSGSAVALTDDNDGGDVSTTVSLPFSFRFYGQDFNDITICSNGWIAMGADQVEHTDFRNYNIPSASGASGMIAPFWDDLRIPPASSPSRSSDQAQRNEVAIDEGHYLAVKAEIEVIEQRLAAATEDENLEPLKNRLAQLYEELGVTPNARQHGNSLDQGGETCANATVISGESVSVSGTLGATDDCVYLRPYFDVFYRYTVPSTGQYQIDMCTSAGDTYLRLWTDGTCCSGSTVYEDDACGDLDPLRQIGLTAGQIVYIECGMYSSTGTPGAYNLHINLLGNPCDNARIIPSIPASFDSTTSGSPAIYTPQLCGSGNSPDVFYQYTPAVVETVTITTCLGTTSFDTRLVVFEDGVEIACSDDDCSNGTIFPNNDLAKIDFLILNPGHTYCIDVTGYSSGYSGNYTLSIHHYTPEGVYTYHDAANHRFIVEWSNIFKWSGSSTLVDETFQVILYQPGYPTTPTGDGEILFQYETCNNTPDAYASNDYATVGIENFTQTDGVLYSYWNLTSPYIPGAATMTSGRAILFTTEKTAVIPADPKAPENLTAISGGGGVVLRWNAVTEDINGNPVSNVQYNIYRGATPDFTPGAGTYVTTVTDTFYTDSPLPGTTNFYVVEAETP